MQAGSRVKIKADGDIFNDQVGDIINVIGDKIWIKLVSYGGMVICRKAFDLVRVV